MKKTILLTALSVALTVGSGVAYKAYADCGMDHSKHSDMNHSEEKTMDHSDHSSHEHAGHDMQSESKEIMGKGVIHSISKMNKKVNLTHEPISALGWPTMTMDLAVAEDVDLKSISPDDEVTFHMVLGDDKIYRITKFMKAGEVMDHDNHEGHKCEAGKDCPMHEGMKHENHDEMKHDHSDDDHGDKNHH